MDTNRLYKYLDAKGGLAMLEHHNLQFTNATRLNDPFDCFPSLIDYSDACTREAEVWGKELIEEVEMSQANNRREDTWICSLSKVYDSLLMWSYYCNHKGVCIGLDRDKTKDSLSHIMHSVHIGAFEWEVQYKKIIEKPDYYRERIDFIKYQLSTKAEVWKHEEEVRFVLVNPMPSVVPHHSSLVSMVVPNDDRYKNATEIDWKELRAYKGISCDCFESVYLGVNIFPEDKTKIISAARKINPELKIYQMTPDPEAFELRAVLID